MDSEASRAARGRAGALRRPLAASAALVATTACCPIPVPRTAVVVPDGTVEVRDRHGAPVAGATVILRKFNVGPPPQREVGRWRATTGDDGTVHYAMRTQTEWILPLMMHGVPQWAWDVCVVAPGYAPAWRRWISSTAISDPEEYGRPEQPLVFELSRTGAGGEAVRPSCPWPKIERSDARDF